MANTDKDRNAKTKIEEMTSIWASGDEYCRGYLNGVIEAVAHMASREVEKRPVA